MMKLATGAEVNDNWQYNDPQYASAQYAKLYGQVTGSNPAQDQLGPFQYQYVDYQPNCKSGGDPVCATNGIKYFHFENDCKLEAHNIKLLFQYGTELELTELERCMPNCDNIKCTTEYAPICAAPESGPHQGKGVTFANECEVRRRECLTKESQRFLNKGPCHQLKSKSKTKSKKSKGRRKHRKHGNSTSPSTSTSTTTTLTANTNRSEVSPSNNFVTLPALPESPTTAATTTTTTTPVPMQYHEYLSQINPGVSVSQAVNAYNVYNIPDVGTDYDEITDSTLSMYLPGVGTVTDTPPKTTSTTTTTTTTTPKPRITTLPSTSSTESTTLPSTATTSKAMFILIPFGTTSTTTVRTSIDRTSSGTSNVTSSGTNKSTSNGNTLSSTTTLTPLTANKNASPFKVNVQTSARTIQKPIQKPIPKPTVSKTQK